MRLVASKLVLRATERETRKREEESERNTEHGEREEKRTRQDGEEGGKRDEGKGGGGRQKKREEIRSERHTHISPCARAKRTRVRVHHRLYARRVTVNLPHLVHESVSHYY